MDNKQKKLIKSLRLIRQFKHNQQDLAACRKVIRDLCKSSGINQLRRKCYELNKLNQELLTKIK